MTEASPLKEKHCAAVTKMRDDLRKFRGRIEGIQRLLPENSSAYSQLATLRLDYCSLLAGPEALASDVAALRMTGQVEIANRVDAHDLELHPAHPTYRDGKLAAANDHS